jgi:small GTP-binding protein
MGSTLSSWFKSLFGTIEARVLMLGFDAAGKTTIIYKLINNEKLETIPTLGFNVETVNYKSVSFTIWDICGQEKTRPLWRHYFSDTQALIYVVDSNDKERIEENHDQLHKILKDENLEDCKVLVLANKQDLPNAKSVDEIIEILKLYEIKQKWAIFGSIAITGEGIYEGLEWLSENIIKN